MKILILLFCCLYISSYSQINYSDKSQEPKIKEIKYDGGFMNFNNIMLTKEQKAGVVGEKITLFKVWTIKNEDGSSISYQDSEKFQNKTFEVIEYIYEYKDILKIKNDDGVFFIEPSSIDEYVFNRYIDTIKNYNYEKNSIRIFDSSEFILKCTTFNSVAEMFGRKWE